MNASAQAQMRALASSLVHMLDMCMCFMLHSHMFHSLLYITHMVSQLHTAYLLVTFEWMPLYFSQLHQFWLDAEAPASALIKSADAGDLTMGEAVAMGKLALVLVGNGHQKMV